MAAAVFSVWHSLSRVRRRVIREYFHGIGFPHRTAAWEYLWRPVYLCKVYTVCAAYRKAWPHPLIYMSAVWGVCLFFARYFPPFFLFVFSDSARMTQVSRIISSRQPLITE